MVLLLSIVAHFNLPLHITDRAVCRPSQLFRGERYSPGGGRTVEQPFGTTFTEATNTRSARGRQRAQACPLTSHRASVFDGNAPSHIGAARRSNARTPKAVLVTPGMPGRSPSMTSAIGYEGEKRSHYRGTSSMRRFFAPPSSPWLRATVASSATPNAETLWTATP